MRKPDVVKRLRRASEVKREPLEAPGHSPVKFRISYLNPLDGLVPVTVRSMGLPSYVCSEVYLDIRHISHIRIQEEKNRHISNAAAITFNSEGVARFNALIDQPDLPSLTVFVNDHPVDLVHCSEKLSNGIAYLSIFESDDEAEYFVNLIRKGLEKESAGKY